jgi:hypothetical protein
MWPERQPKIDREVAEVQGENQLRTWSSHRSKVMKDWEYMNPTEMFQQGIEGNFILRNVIIFYFTEYYWINYIILPMIEILLQKFY